GSVVHEPDFIVLDEPFSGLDPVNQNRLEALIHAQRDRGATILVVETSEALRVNGLSAASTLEEMTVVLQRMAVVQAVPDSVDESDPEAAEMARLAALLPPDAVREGDGFRFVVPDEGIEPLLSRLIAAGHGISGLSIERPSLHDVFVRIVGPDALEETPA
ncbi:MAG TPA: ABC transporter ATP-binding protein, partial [Sphingomonas bacterium]|nr:ABC transporter ATP-binding protein [Sphingomonas bacterium]